VTKLVVDASVAMKWVVTEAGSEDAVRLLKAVPLAAPDLLITECANILWRKVQRQELMPDEALMAARLLERADIEILPTRHLLEAATRIAIDLEHPAYDCIYLSLAIANNWRFVTADERLLNRLSQMKSSTYAAVALSIADASAHFSGAT
jgi:predicted nucleic acid-binding protein